MEKIVYIKNIFESGNWEDAYPSKGPHPNPLDPSLAIIYGNDQKSGIF